MNEKEFSETSPHHENVKVSIDNILGQETTLRKVKKSKEDHKKILFSKILDNIFLVEDRAIRADQELSLDMTSYDTPFFNIIEDLLALHFNKEQVNLINFYMYDRFETDGGVLELMDEEGNIVPLNNSNDLWELLKKFNK